MADNIKISRVTNAKVYVDGNSYLGRAESIEMPEIVVKVAEHNALGLVFDAEFFSGFEKMMSKIKWTSFYADVLKKIANPTQMLPMQVRASIANWTGQGLTSEVPLVMLMRVMTKKFPLGNFQKSDNVALETEHSVYYIKQTIDGEDIIEADVLNNIYKVDGVDILAQYRANLGE